MEGLAAVWKEPWQGSCARRVSSLKGGVFPRRGTGELYGFFMIEIS